MPETMPVRSETKASGFARHDECARAVNNPLATGKG